MRIQPQTVVAEEAAREERRKQDELLQLKKIQDALEESERLEKLRVKKIQDELDESERVEKLRLKQLQDEQDEEIRRQQEIAKELQEAADQAASAKAELAALKAQQAQDQATIVEMQQQQLEQAAIRLERANKETTAKEQIVEQPFGEWTSFTIAFWLSFTKQRADFASSLRDVDGACLARLLPVLQGVTKLDTLSGADTSLCTVRNICDDCSTGCTAFSNPAFAGLVGATRHQGAVQRNMRSTEEERSRHFPTDFTASAPCMKICVSLLCVCFACDPFSSFGHPPSGLGVHARPEAPSKVGSEPGRECKIHSCRRYVSKKFGQFHLFHNHLTLFLLQLCVITPSAA